MTGRKLVMISAHIFEVTRQWCARLCTSRARVEQSDILPLLRTLRPDLSTRWTSGTSMRQPCLTGVVQTTCAKLGTMFQVVGNYHSFFIPGRSSRHRACKDYHSSVWTLIDVLLIDVHLDRLSETITRFLSRAGLDDTGPAKTITRLFGH